MDRWMDKDVVNIRQQNTTQPGKRHHATAATRMDRGHHTKRRKLDEDKCHLASLMCRIVKK